MMNKISDSLADLEAHERKLGRKMNWLDKDWNYWMWKLVATDTLIYRWKRRFEWG